MAYKDWLNEKENPAKGGSVAAKDIPVSKGMEKPVTTPTTPTTPTAPEYTFEQYLTDERARYDQLYKDTLAQIAASREKTIVDAGAARAKQVGTYGANAERLASIGLTGSGYSDYLTAQAHSAYRGDVQAANALAAQQELTAKQGYEETMAGLRKMEYEQYATQKSKVDTIKTNIENGAYKNLSRLQEAAEAAGLSPDKVQEVLSYYNDVNKEAINTTYAESVVNEDGTTTDTLKALTDEDIDALVSSGKITAPAAADLKKQRNEKLIDAIRKAAEDSADIGNFQSYLLNYKDILGDDVVRELNYEYNAKIALNGLTYDNLQGEIDKVFAEANGGKLDAKDALALGAYKISHISKGVYVPTGDVFAEKAFSGSTNLKSAEGARDKVDILGSSIKASEAMGKALSEYAGTKTGTLVYMGAGDAYVYDGKDWLKVTRYNREVHNSLSEKSYDLPKKDNGYSEYLTTK